jgi:hypothetical protein
VIPCGPVLRRDLGYYLVSPVSSRKEPKVKAFTDWVSST